MRKLTFSTVLVSALLIVSNIASAAIVYTDEGGYSYQKREIERLNLVYQTKADDARDWRFGLYYTTLDGEEILYPLRDGLFVYNLHNGIEDVGVWAVQGAGKLDDPDVASRIVYSFKNNTVSGFNFSMTEIGTKTFTFGKDGEVKGTITITGYPLPTPVVTLLIALALGAGFVMYRNRKQQAEA